MTKWYLLIILFLSFEAQGQGKPPKQIHSEAKIQKAQGQSQDRSRSRLQARDKVPNPCERDIEVLCKNQNQADGGVMKCLVDNEAKLSPRCRSNKREMKSILNTFTGACMSDFEKFCGSTRLIRGIVMRCMNEHRKELTPTCRDEISNPRPRRKK